MSLIVKSGRRCSGVFLILAGALLAPMAVRALDPSLPPSGNFDLSHWYLGLPVDSSGGTTGDSASITTAQLLAGYTNALYFYTGPDGAMTFWAPVTGATTSGSSFPRSELRELLSPPSTTVNWLGFGLHTLDAQLKVLEVPSTKKVIIGQIHGFTGSALPLVKIQYNNGVIEGLVKTNADDDGSDFKFTYANVGLSNAVNYEIKVLNGLVSIAVNGVTNSMNVFQTDPNWATNTLYFKAGDYCQDNVGTTNEGARVAFYSVALAHAPSITNQPTGQTVVAGSNTSFSVGALGNVPLTYRWRLNATNITGATNALLILNNVLSTDAGDYSVVVNDRIGSVTSIVATLTVNVPTNNVTTNAFYRWDADTNSAGIQDGTGTWTNVNWSQVGDGSDDVGWLQGSDAVFGGGRSGTAGAITVTSVRAHNLTFNQPFTGNYTITGSTLTLTNGPTITINNGGDATIASNLRGNNGFIKDGPGALTLNVGTSNFYAGTVVVSNGMLNLGSAGGKVTIDVGGVQVCSNATLQYASGKAGLFNAGASITNSGGTVQWGSSETNPLINFVLQGGLVTNNTTSDRTILVSGSYVVESGVFAFNPNIVPGVSTNAKALILAGTAGLTKTGPGTAYILGNFNISTLGASIKNAYTGITTISGGILNIGFDRAVGTNPPAFSANQLTLDGGMLQLAAGYAWGDNRGVTLTGNGGTIDTMTGVTQTIQVPIAGVAGGGLTKAGSGTLTLNTNNAYNGNTTVGGGTLALSGNGSISNSPVITVAGGATLDVSGLATGLALGNGQTLRASGAGSTATIVTDAGSGLTLGATSGLQFSAYDGANAPLTVAGDGTLALAAGNVATVTVARGTPLGAGNYKLISTNGTGGSVSGVAPAAVTVNGDGLVGGATASLVINNAELILQVANGFIVNTNATNIVSSVAGGNLTLSWPSDHTGWTLQTQTNGVGVGLGSNWFDVAGSAGTNVVVLPVGTSSGSVFFRLKYP